MLDCATARELGLVTTGHAQRGVSSVPSPGASNLHLEAGRLSPEELIADIKDGFYVTDLIGMGVNMVTGDYSRGASGFWIENGKTHLRGERGHHRRASARHVPHAHARQRSRIPLRHQCADGAAGGLDRCRPVIRAGLRAPLETVMREAGELARATARGPFKRWTKGDDHSPVSEGDIAVNDLLRARLTRLTPAAGWLSEETEDMPRPHAAAQAWIVDPIDGTRAYIAGRADWTISVALVEDGRPRLAALYAPVTDEMFLARAAPGAALNGAPIARQPRRDA